MGVAETGRIGVAVDCSDPDTHYWLGLFARWREAYGLMRLHIVYFARVREAVGVDSEQVAVEAGTSIAKLIEGLAAKSDRHAAILSRRSKLRFALDQKMVRADALLNGATELAIFPPVTGG